MSNSNGINVVSLFNGMGALRQAMENLGIRVNKYYSSEIKPFAIKLQQYHFPDDYCDILSRNQAASLLGDGWTLPVIEHILSFYNPQKS